MKTIFDTELKNKIIEAKKHPFLWPEIEEYLTEEKKLFTDLHYGKLKKEEFERKHREILAKVPLLLSISYLSWKRYIDI